MIIFILILILLAVCFPETMGAFIAYMIMGALALGAIAVVMAILMAVAA